MMLQSLSIRDVALIGRLDMDFSDGFNVLTGETGAGKSIVIDAVNLVLGERGNRELIRHDAAKARVEAVFSGEKSPNIVQLLQENGIDEADELVLSRELSESGKNTCRINGSLVTLATLKNLTDQLVDVHGQHAHQALLNPRSHMAFLDAFGTEDLISAKAGTEEAARRYHALLRENKLESMPEAERLREAELLRYQINEIQSAKLWAGEEDALMRERAVLANAEKIMETMEQSYALLNDERGALPSLRSAEQGMAAIADYAQAYADIHAGLESAYYALEDTVYALRDCRAGFEFDAGRLEEIEQRLECIAALKRKYGKTTDEVLQYAEEAGDKLDALEHAAVRWETLQRELAACLAAYRDAAFALRAARQSAAQRLQKRVEAQLAELGMEKTRFTVCFTPTADAGVLEAGLDDIEFLLSANPGEPLKPLSRVASGGELSRIMLAFKTISADADAVPVLIFDEIDSGISGKMASITGSKMVSIAKTHQVICVTHLPQIAAFADAHFLVEKSANADATRTEVKLLGHGESAARLAVMMSGDTDSAIALGHAQELLAACEKEKQTIRRGEK